MALTLVHFDGFDDYSTAQLARNGSSIVYFTVASGEGRNGTGALKAALNYDSSRFLVAIPTSASALVSVAFKASAFNLLTQIIQFMDGAVRHVDLRITPTGQLSVTRDGTELANSGDFRLSPNQYYHIAFAATIADAPNGKYDVWIDGINRVATGGNTDTRNAGNASCNTIQLGHYPGGASTALTMWYDDFAVFSGATYSDADFPGDCRVITNLPNADGDYADWTASAGTDVSCVDENPATDDTDYISSATVDQMETFGFAPISGTGNVLGVMEVITDRMDDAGPRSINGIARLGTTDLVGSTPMPCSSSFVSHKELFLAKPGGGAWTLSDVNSAQFGVKLIS